MQDYASNVGTQHMVLALFLGALAILVGVSFAFKGKIQF